MFCVAPLAENSRCFMSSHISPLHLPCFKFLPCSSLEWSSTAPSLSVTLSSGGILCVPTLSTTAGTQTCFCLAELTGRHSSGNPGLRARPCSCTSKQNHLTLLRRKSPLGSSGGHRTESQLGKNLSSKFSLPPGILSGVLWKFPALSPPPPNCCSVLKLIRDADEAPNTYCSAPASSRTICQSLCRGRGGRGWINQLISQNGTIAEEQQHWSSSILYLLHSPGAVSPARH